MTCRSASYKQPSVHAEWRSRTRRGAASIADVETPSVLIDVDVLNANITRMSRHARDVGVQLRPHIKTHKATDIAAMQRAAGVSGFTVATVQEAEMMVGAGFADLLVAYPPVGDWRVSRLAKIMEVAKLTFLIDSVPAATSAARLARELGTVIPFLWEVDCGAERSGTPPGIDSVDMAAEAQREEGLRLAGFLTFPGHAYASQSRHDLDLAVSDEMEAASVTAEAARAAGLGALMLSGGTTPTAWLATRDTPLTEIRPGNYVFHDATQVALGVCALGDCALRVLTTVVSRPNRKRIVVDAGAKALGREVMNRRTVGYGVVADRPELAVTGLYEEHGLIEAPEDVHDVPIGSRLELVPNHSCVTANLHDAHILRRGDEIIDVISIGARRGTARDASYGRKERL
jgi:D-serine deaminase-like pyridoxal phosphate-dependent protein